MRKPSFLRESNIDLGPRLRGLFLSLQGEAHVAFHAAPSPQHRELSVISLTPSPHDEETTREQVVRLTRGTAVLCFSDPVTEHRLRLA